MAGVCFVTGLAGVGFAAGFATGFGVGFGAAGFAAAGFGFALTAAGLAADGAACFRFKGGSDSRGGFSG